MWANRRTISSSRLRDRTQRDDVLFSEFTHRQSMSFHFHFNSSEISSFQLISSCCRLTWINVSQYRRHRRSLKIKNTRAKDVLTNTNRTQPCSALPSPPPRLRAEITDLTQQNVTRGVDIVTQKCKYDVNGGGLVAAAKDNSCGTGYVDDVILCCCDVKTAVYRLRPEKVISLWLLLILETKLYARL